MPTDSFAELDSWQRKFRLGLHIDEIKQVPTPPTTGEKGVLYVTPYGNYLFNSWGLEKIEGNLEVREEGDGFICLGEFDFAAIPTLSTAPEEDNENLSWEKAILEGIK